MNILLAIVFIVMLAVIAWNIKQGFLLIEERLKAIEEQLKADRQ